jgi:hypothetical protein
MGTALSPSVLPTLNHAKLPTSTRRLVSMIPREPWGRVSRIRPSGRPAWQTLSGSSAPPAKQARSRLVPIGG